MILEITTPIEKQVRTTRHFDRSSFSILPGQYVELLGDGSVRNVVPGSPAVNNKISWSSVSDNKYESQDSDAGSLTTIEGCGVRMVVDKSLVIGSPVAGDVLAVCATYPNAGKLFSMRENPNSVSGNYEAVAVVEEVDGNTAVVIKTVSHEIVSLPIGSEPVIDGSPVVMYYFSQMSQDYGY